jgi:hypothetical protein
LIRHSCVLFGKLIEQVLEPGRRAVDFLLESLVLVQRRRELVTQLVFVRTPALAELRHLVYFLFQRFEFHVHRDTIEVKILISQLLRIIFECGLYEQGGPRIFSRAAASHNARVCLHDLSMCRYRLERLLKMPRSAEQGTHR